MNEYIISNALLKNINIDIIYMSDKGITERSIKPIKLDGDILEAYCYLKKSVRRFRVENILGASYTKAKRAG
ncbi:MAG: hypothetical protein ACOZCL_01455 [Bacillota bacterium]